MPNRHPLTMRIPLLEMGKVVDEGRRAEDEKDWIANHPGYEFGVYANGELVSTHPSLPVARRAARPLAGQGKNIRIKDVRHPDRSYWHEETDNPQEK